MHVLAKPQAIPNKKDPLASFLGISYQDPHAFEKARQQLDGRLYPREQLIIALRKYNLGIGNDENALSQIDLFSRPGSACIITGQQLGLMGGPAYTILKGITCLLLAREVGAIPVFWLATEDHDVNEINHTYILDALGNLKRYQLSFPKDGRCAEDLQLSSKNKEVINEFLQTLKIPSASLPSASASYSETMACMMARLFAGTGMVFLEPKILRPMAKEFFHREIVENDMLQRTLKETSSRLESAGGHPLLPLGEGTNLFFKADGMYRTKIQRDTTGFNIGSNHYATDELLDLIEKHPELFSTGVAARPVLQSALLPTLAYVAGPAEISYHRQLSDYFQKHNVPMPCVVPRLSASFIPPEASEILHKLNLSPWDDIPMHWDSLMPELKQSAQLLESDWKQSANQHFHDDLDPHVLARYIKLGTRKLLRKIVKARLRKQHIPSHGLHLLLNLLHPHNNLQERVLNWWGFQSKARSNLILECLDHLCWNAEGHQYIYFS